MAENEIPDDPQWLARLLAVMTEEVAIAKDRGIPKAEIRRRVGVPQATQFDRYLEGKTRLPFELVVRFAHATEQPLDTLLTKAGLISERSNLFDQIDADQTLVPVLKDFLKRTLQSAYAESRAQTLELRRQLR